MKWINEVVMTPVVSSGQPTGQEAATVNQITTGATSQLGHPQATQTLASIRASVVINNTAPVHNPPTQLKQIVKKKVVEIEPEPKYMRLDENVTPLELLLNANCDYCRYRCRVNAIRFRDTLMFQTRVFE